MHIPILPLPLRIALVSATILSLTACADTAERLARIGSGPQLTTIENPTEEHGYQPVRMPMPQPERLDTQAGSLWQSGARAFFKDQRAARVGDILTVNVVVQDKAKLENSTTRTRTATEGAGVNNLLGLENTIDRLGPDGIDAKKLLGATSNSSSTGDGQIDRKEEINMRVAAVVTQVLPNGNLAVKGQQEILINKEKRELYVAGVVRPEDISSANDIRYDQIAEARIRYGGAGTLSDVQSPRYGQELADIILPF